MIEQDQDSLAQRKDKEKGDLALGPQRGCRMDVAEGTLVVNSFTYVN